MERLRQLVGEVASGKVTGRIVNIGPKDAVGNFAGASTCSTNLVPCFGEQQTVLRMAGREQVFPQGAAVGLHGVFRDALLGSNQSWRCSKTMLAWKRLSAKRQDRPRRRLRN